MSVVHSYGKEIISINESGSIIIETKSEEGYEWKEVSFKTNGEEEIGIGSYSTYNYSSSREWMEYNDNVIALLAIYTYGYEASDTYVQVIFDIQSKQLIKGSQEELVKIYNQEFNELSKKKTLTTK